MNVAAIDPGNDGAYAIYNGKDTWVQKNYADGTTDPRPMVLDMLSAGVKKVLIEDISGGGATSQTAAIQWGRIKQCLIDNNIGVEKVHPSTWKAFFKIRGTKEESAKDKKARSINLARELFPTISLRPTERSKVDSNDFAEALLILNWGIRTGALR